MNKSEQTRQEWEQEFRQLQENVLVEDRLRNCDILLERAKTKTPLLSRTQFYIVITMGFLIALGFCWYFKL